MGVQTQDLEVLKVDELNEKIKASGYKSSYLYTQMGMSRNSFDLKRKGKIPFRVPEIYMLANLLGMTEEEKLSIFYGES